MAVFEYRGIAVATGKQTKGVRDADNPKALRAQLKREGVLITEAVEGKSAAADKGRKVDFMAIFRKVTVSDLSTMTRQLSTLVRAGIPLVDAMTALTEQTEKLELLRVLTQVRDRLNEGLSLAKSLEEHPKVFAALYTNMVAAGEASGTLEKVLERLADFLEEQARLQSKVTSALAYPILMTLIGCGLLTVMMTVVVPKVTGIFASMDRALPWYTELLIVISNAASSPVTGGAVIALITVMLARRAFFHKVAADPALPAFRVVFAIAAAASLAFLLIVDGTSIGYYLLGYIIGVGFGVGLGRFRQWVQTPKGLLWKDSALLKLPVFGDILRLVAVARFTRTLGTLLQSGVSLLKAMEIVRNVVENARMRLVIEEVTDSIREGQSISLPLKRSREFPPMAVHMIAVGEKSGQLEQMLENVAKEYDRQVESRVTAMTSLLEPLVIVLMGGGVGFITFAIMMPLIQMNDFVQ
jgi:general secretion pathway protein F